MAPLYTLTTEHGVNMHLFSKKSGSKELQYRTIIIQITVLMIVIKTCRYVCNTILIWSSFVIKCLWVTV